MSAKLKSSSKKRKCSDVKHTPIGNYFQKITFHDNKQKISPVANISERLNHIEKTIVKENKSLFLSDDIIPPTPEQVINNNTPRKNYAQSKNSSKKYIENSSKIFSLTKTINSNKNLLELNSKDASESLTNVSSLLDCKSVPEKYKKNMLLSKAIKRTTNESQNCTKVKKKISKIEIQENHSMLIQDEDDDDDFLKGYGYDTHKLKKQLTSIKSFSKSSLNDKLIDFVDTNHMGSDFLHKHQTITNDSLLESEDFFLEVNDTDLVEDLTNHKLMLLKVKEVTPRFYISSDFGSKKEILLILESTKGTYSCHLREDWINMEVEVNDLAYVSGFSSKCFQYVLDNSSSHFITLYPNTLISGTCISTGIFCDRNAVLNEHFKNDEQNEAMLLGTITHDLFDWAVQNNSFSEKELEKQAQKMLCTPKYIELLYGIDKDEAQMLSNLQEYFSSIADWQNSFLNPSGKEIFFKTGQEFQSENNSALVHIQRIIDIEENIWAPCLGLKGKIDVSVELVVQRKPKVNKYTAPLELKTGKMFSATGSIEHRAQVALYTILMSEKYSQNIDAGLLLYLKTKHLQGIPVPLHERRALIIKRNSIARKLTLERDDLTMPGLLGDKHKCTRCFQNQTCMLYHMAIENGDANTSGVDKLFIKLTQHINRDQLEFFKRWYELIMMEIKYEEKTNKKKYFWLETSQACEARGDCLSGMKVAHESRTSDEKLHYIFRKCNHSFNVGMLQIHFIIGERVIVSEENKKVYNTVAGYIIDVSSETVTISVNRKIPSSKISSTFRIDKDGFQSIYKIPLSNLSKLYKKDSPKDEKIRRLIINKEPPRFSIEKSEEIRCSQLLALNGSESVQGAALNSIFSKLNAVQKAAIEKCLVAEDYLIMLGMPGAGKSTTIACLVRALVLMGKSVLLTSYTHSAVDTILVKLLDAGFESFLRIGESSRVNNKVIHLTSKEQTKHFSSTYQLKDFYSKQNVVATTCLGISHPIFLHKHFDYCIVDEASQVTLPVCIGPIRYANAFILVGDHNQLPPLVQSPDAREKGLDVSLFRLLTEAHPEAVLTLNHQYRMNNQIMLLTNSLIYNNAMKCGNDDVAGARIKLPLYESYKENCQDFLLHILNPERSVVFIDTDASEMFQEKKTSHGVVNQGEARLVKDILDGFLHSGLTAKDIGVISPYRQQLKIIRKELSTLTANVEVDTIDKYQGKDKKCIIVSLVRSNKLEEIGDLLTDWRRVNVAITRAKTKLILIGSASTVKQSDIFDRMLKILEREKWIFSSV